MPLHIWSSGDFKWEQKWERAHTHIRVKSKFDINFDVVEIVLAFVLTQCIAESLFPLLLLIGLVCIWRWYSPALKVDNHTKVLICIGLSSWFVVFSTLSLIYINIHRIVTVAFADTQYRPHQMLQNHLVLFGNVCCVSRYFTVFIFITFLHGFVN